MKLAEYRLNLNEPMAKLIEVTCGYVEAILLTELLKKVFEHNPNEERFGK